MPILKEGSLLQRGVSYLCQPVVSYLFSYFEESKDTVFALRLKGVATPELEKASRDVYRFKHSGNAGDIIYALPAMYALSHDSPSAIYLKLNVHAPYGKRIHPLGNVMLNETMLNMLGPLLEAQPRISSCQEYTSQELDYDLDLMRSYPFPLHAGHIARWYFLTFAVNADLGKPWLTVVPDPAYADYLVIGRSQRYRAPTIDYSFLRKYPKIAFVGVEAELNDMRLMIPGIEYRPVGDFLELAQIIAGSKLFIGNQSFPFSIAEALKVKRLLEVCHLCPNVIVEGPNGYDFCYQPQFEKLAERLMC